MQDLTKALAEFILANKISATELSGNTKLRIRSRILFKYRK